MAIVDWKEVPTWSEFEILKERFEKMRVPVVLADPRELDFDGKRLSAKGKEDRSGVPAGADQRHCGPAERVRSAGEGV